MSKAFLTAVVALAALPVLAVETYPLPSMVRSVDPPQGHVNLGENVNPLGCKQISIMFSSSPEKNENCTGEFAIYVDGEETPKETVPVSKSYVDNMGVPTVGFEFKNNYNTPGNYRVTIPEGAWIVKGEPTPAFELGYEVSRDFSISPSTNAVASEFSQWIMTCDEADQVIYNGTAIEFYPQGSNVSWDITPEVIDQGEGIKKNKVRLANIGANGDYTIFNTPGVYQMHILEGTFTSVTYGPNYANDPQDIKEVKNDEMRLNYYVASTPKPAIEPAEGVVNDFKTFTLTMPEGFTLMFGDTMTRSRLLIGDRSGEATELLEANVKTFAGDWDVKAGTLTLTVVDEMDQKITEPLVPAAGYYVLRLSPAQFSGNYSGGRLINSDPFEYLYQIKDPIFDIVADPASGETLDVIENIELAFPKAEYMNVNEDENAPKAKVIAANGREMDNEVEISMQAGIAPWNDEVSDSAIRADIVVKPAITRKGTWTIQIPEGAFKSGEELSPAYTLTYVCTGTAGVDGIADEVETYDIYTLTGITVALGADEAVVENLPAGLYIINGKKVIVKK